MLDEFCTHLAARGAASSTIELRRFHLMRMSHLLPDGLLSASTADLEQILARCSARSYKRSLRATMRLFFEWAHQAGLIDGDPAAPLLSVKPAPPAPRPVSDPVWLAALDAADDRERVMLRLAGECGLRRAEVAKVHADDLMSDLLGPCLLVHGKGDKQRLIPISSSIAHDIKRELAGRGGWLFPSPAGGHLTPGHVGKILSALLPEGVKPHQLRHRFATRTYGASQDLFAVQQLLGHASPATTQLYVAIDASRLRAVSALAA